ncbi:Fungal-trans domain-containing protein [Fusarium sp. LHS14.1]|nr:Fungal-trans domain-containing protein [Fusarium sp. LHS14.1]
MFFSPEQPSCANCQRSSEPCVYDARKNKPGVKVGAVEGLSKRLETLEQAFHDQAIQQNATASFDSSNVTSSIAHLTGAITSLASEIQRLSSRPDPPHASVLNGDGDDPDEGIRAHKRRRVQGHQLGSHSQETLSSNETIRSLPPGLIEELVQLYFDRVFYWIPVIHYPRFREEIKQEPGRQRLRVVLDAMLVATLRFIDGRRYSLSADDIERLIEERHNSVLISTMRSLSIESLQALVILAFTTIGDGEPSATWPSIASMTRTVDFLQLMMEREISRTRYLVLTMPLPNSIDWVQEEERRRVFWNVFNLDRYCSITTGWSTGIASDKINLRLPANGSYWYAETPVVCPYFAISVPSDAAIGSPYALAHTQCSTCGQVSTADSCNLNISVATNGRNPSLTDESSNASSMGGFSYAVQATEYLNRIATCFLYPEVDFDDQQQVIAWLTRFKELDLHLVHWKMFLPKKWRDPNQTPDTSTGPHDLDHSMTLAHVTHNTSMILLHHRIAYPPSRQRQVVPLPSSCSAETCRLAATKTSNIAETWLRVCPKKIVVAPQIAFCTLISARLLLAHSRYYNEALMPEFWLLVRSLEDMSRRWAGVTRGESGHFLNLAGKYALHLRNTYEICQQDVTYNPVVLDYTENIEQAMSYHERDQSRPQRPRTRDNNDDLRSMPTSISGQKLGSMPSHPMVPQESVSSTRPQDISTGMGPPIRLTGTVDGPEHVDSMSFTATNPDVQELPEDLLAISQALMDQRFAEMDRIITLDDSWFETTAQAADVSSLHVPGWNTAEMGFTNLQGDRSSATGRD